MGAGLPKRKDLGDAVPNTPARDKPLDPIGTKLAFCARGKQRKW